MRVPICSNCSTQKGEYCSREYVFSAKLYISLDLLYSTNVVYKRKNVISSCQKEAVYDMIFSTYIVVCDMKVEKSVREKFINKCDMFLL